MSVEESRLTNQPHLWTTHNQSQIQEITPIPLAKDGTPPEEWLGGVHPDGQLELTKGFYLHPDKMSRLLSFLAYDRRGEQALYKQLAQNTGMPESRVEALIQCEVSMLLLVPRSLRVTPLGHLLLEYDPFFDRPGTLWLLHYLIASNPMLVVWNYTCNAVLPSVAEISDAEAADQFLSFAGRWSESSIRKKVRKELRAFFAAYIELIFAPLSYLCEVEPNEYAVNRDVLPVPPLIAMASALVYRDRHQPGATGVEIPTLVYADHSPGRIMRQRELRIREALDTLHEMGQLTIESKANLDQVRIRSQTTWLDAVRAYYEEQQG